jgi:uncharacterized protein (TIGR03086 family)
VTAAEHHRAVAGEFTRRVDVVSDWTAPAPVAGWTTRDVVGHLLTWLPGFLAGGGVDLDVDGPTAEDDPAGAWHARVRAVQALLEAPDAGRDFNHPRVGDHRLDAAIDRFYVTDVFLHTWDLARASGQDDRLDPDFCADLLAGLEPMDAALRASGQYGARVRVSEDAPVQDRLLGFIGRDPLWQPGSGWRVVRERSA